VVVFSVSESFLVISMYVLRSVPLGSSDQLYCWMSLWQIKPGHEVLYRVNEKFLCPCKKCSEAVPLMCWKWKLVQVPYTWLGVTWRGGAWRGWCDVARRGVTYVVWRGEAWRGVAGVTWRGVAWLLQRIPKPVEVTSNTCHRKYNRYNLFPTGAQGLFAHPVDSYSC
jgi:hypothetical protein